MFSDGLDEAKLADLAELARERRAADFKRQLAEIERRLKALEERVEAERARPAASRSPHFRREEAARTAMRKLLAALVELDAARLLPQQRGEPS